MPAFRLYDFEKEFLREVMNGAVLEIDSRDSQKCAEYACRALLTDKKTVLGAKGSLRPIVLNKIKSGGISFIKRLLIRHEPFVALPKPLRGTALHRASQDLGLIARDSTVKVDVATLKEECLLAGARKVMKMEDDIGRESKRVMMQKKKRKTCIDEIVKKAQQTGVADITTLWREYYASKATLVSVALQAIQAVAQIKTVYVLDIHSLTCLFPIATFEKMLALLTNSSIFAINMGEDSMILGSEHFKLLATKIMDGSIPIRRWFVEVHPQRRPTLIKWKLLSKNHRRKKSGLTNNPNAFKIARTEDKALWLQGKRDMPRLAWLAAPKSAYVGAKKYKVDMQSTTCKWKAACNIRDAGENARSSR